MALWSCEGEDEDEQAAIGNPWASWTRLSWATIFYIIYLETWLKITSDRQEKCRKRQDSKLNLVLHYPLP